MNCARCHDSPVNDVTQKQLFSIAAMLSRKAIELPKTSTVLVEAGDREPRANRLRMLGGPLNQSGNQGEDY